MKKSQNFKLTIKNKSNKSKSFTTKFIITLIFIVVAGVYALNQLSQPTDINLVGSRLGGGTGQKDNDSLTSKTTLKEAVNSNQVSTGNVTKPISGRTVVVQDKPIPAGYENTNKSDDNPFAGTQAGGGTSTNKEILERRVEEQIQEVVTLVEEKTGKEISSINNAKDPNQLNSNGGRCLGDDCVVSTKTGTNNTLSPDKQGKSPINTSGSPDDRQEKNDSLRALFDGAVGGGYKGTDENGSEITLNTKTEKLSDGGEFVTTVRTVTAPSGNQVVVTTRETKDQSGKTTDTKSVTVTRTKNTDGTYAIISENQDGETRFINAKTNSETLSPDQDKTTSKIFAGSNLNPDSKDNRLIIKCKDGEVKVDTSRGAYCASPSAPNCGNVGFPLNGKCYWIGEEVSPGNKVCDWTIGGRKGVDYPFLSTNCPTKSATDNQAPKNSQECSAGDNAGWWDDNAKKCYRPGQSVKLDANTLVPVCEGGRIGLNGTCPEFVPTNNQGNLGYDKNSGQFNPQYPTTGTTGTLSPDKQSNEFNAPDSCNFTFQCGVAGTEKCSNNGKFWQKGICVPTNPTLSPDKQSDQFNKPIITTDVDDSLSPDKQSAVNGGMGRFVQKKDGKTDELVNDESDCMLAGAQKNKYGKYVCPGLDGSIDSALDETLCQFSATKPSTWGCVVEIIINSISNPTKENDSLENQKDQSRELGSSVDSNTLEISNDSRQYNNYEEGADCLDLAGTGKHGIIRNGVCDLN